MSERTMTMLRFGGLAGLLLSMMLVLYLVARSQGGPRGQTHALPDNVQEQLRSEGVQGPVGLPNDPRAAANAIAQQECVAPCQAEFSACRSSAEDPRAEQGCQRGLERCRDACTQPDAPAQRPGPGRHRGL